MREGSTSDASDERDRRSGLRIGPWRVETFIGQGATSTVHAATNLETGERAAIKVLRAALSVEPELVEQFLAEGYLVNGIAHPGVVNVLGDGFTADNCPYLVLELLVGQTLDELRSAHRGRVPIAEVMPIADAIMDTLISVHASGITHRDLKPQNVMILDGGGVKVLDFGLAKVRGRTADAAQSVVGTPSFMPPEQALGLPKKMDGQSDVWALGATLFQVLSGQPVHLAADTSAMLLASASTRPRSLADAAPDLPPAIISVIDRALSYRKIDRWPDISSMRSAWQAAHPNWLPTLPPPSFDADPAFIDSDLLVPEAHTSIRPMETPLAVVLFDPQELSAQRDEFSRAPASRRRAVGKTIGLGILGLVTVTFVTAAAILAADDRPQASAAPPPPVMELPEGPVCEHGLPCPPATR